MGRWLVGEVLGKSALSCVTLQKQPGLAHLLSTSTRKLDVPMCRCSRFGIWAPRGAAVTPFLAEGGTAVALVSILLHVNRTGPLLCSDCE